MFHILLDEKNIYMAVTTGQDCFTFLLFLITIINYDKHCIIRISTKINKT